MDAWQVLWIWSRNVKIKSNADEAEHGTWAQWERAFLYLFLHFPFSRRIQFLGSDSIACVHIHPIKISVYIHPMQAYFDHAHWTGTRRSQTSAIRPSTVANMKGYLPANVQGFALRLFQCRQIPTSKETQSTTSRLRDISCKTQVNVKHFAGEIYRQ